MLQKLEVSIKRRHSWLKINLLYQLTVLEIEKNFRLSHFKSWATKAVTLVALMNPVCPVEKLTHLSALLKKSSIFFFLLHVITC